MISKAGRPRLLFLAWTFPPAHTMGAVRTWNIAKHLARLGWEVTVVTPDPRLWRNPEKTGRTTQDLAKEGIRRIPTGHDWRLLTSDRMSSWSTGLGWLVGGVSRRIARRLGISRGIGWIRAAERACMELQSRDVDIILASGPPFAPFVLAERLSRRLARPYVLDYRDPWWTEVTDMIQGLQPVIDRLEGRLVAGCAAVTIVSRSWAFDLETRFKVGAKTHVITNGYDPEDLADVVPHDFGHFAIVYAGIFYPPERVITPVLMALKVLDLKDPSGNWHFHYYGDQDRHVREEAVKLGIAHRVQLHGLVPRAEALSAIRGAHIAVVIASVFKSASAGISGWIPGKLFEIIGLGTPILLIAPPGGDVESIAEPSGLARRFTGDDIDGIAGFIEELMRGLTLEKRDVDFITWDRIAQRLHGVLHKELDRFRTAAHAG